MDRDAARYVVSVMAPDRVGLISDVTAALFGLGGNIEALSQTIMHGWFTMILSVSFRDEPGLESVREGVSAAASCEVLVDRVSGGEGVSREDGEPYIVSIVGDDKPGIIRRVSRFFSERGVNVEDVWNEVREGRFIMIFTVIVPPAVDPKEVRYGLGSALEGLGVSARMQHQDVFTATNSLSIKTRRAPFKRV